MAVLPTAGRRALQLIRSCGVGRVHASSYHSTTVERNADVSPAPAATAGAQQATSSIHDMAYSPSWYALGVNEELRVMMKKTGAKKHSNLIQAKVRITGMCSSRSTFQNHTTIKYPRKRKQWNEIKYFISWRKGKV